MCSEWWPLFMLVGGKIQPGGLVVTTMRIIWRQIDMNKVTCEMRLFSDSQS